MECPNCHADQSKVIDTRKTDDGQAIRRRRECMACQFRFTTFERVQTVPLLVVKKDGSREEFNSDKILNGIVKASEKRPVSYQDMEKIVDNVEVELRKNYGSEVSSEVIGEMVMDHLIELDEVAYIRFASVYRQFKDVDTFLSEVQRLEEKKEGSKN